MRTEKGPETGAKHFKFLGKKKNKKSHFSVILKGVLRRRRRGDEGLLLLFSSYPIGYI